MKSIDELEGEENVRASKRLTSTQASSPLNKSIMKVF